MAHTVKETKFIATADRGLVSGILTRPAEAGALVVLGHGAGTNMRHATLQTIAEALAAVGLATFRYNFPYSEVGRGRDAQPVCEATVRSAISKAHEIAPDLPIFAGGHSFGGRMTSNAAADVALDGVEGLIFFSFPLHPPGKPDVKRAVHLNQVSVPMLFLSGTRDKLADLNLLQQVCMNLGERATLHPLNTADHGYRTLKRLRKSEEPVFEEMARVAQGWTTRVQAMGLL